jgi:hypothetical protein
MGTSDHDFFPFKEVWFVGAFGRWWRGGVVDSAWPPRPSPHSKGDEEGWSSGILNIKSLDQFEDFNGEPNDGIDAVGLCFSLILILSFLLSMRFYTQASPSQLLPTTLAHPSDRHPPNYALVIDQRLVVTTALHRLHSQNLPSYLFTHPSTASPRQPRNPRPLTNGPHLNAFLLYLPLEMVRLPMDLRLISILFRRSRSSPNK